MIFDLNSPTSNHTELNGLRFMNKRRQSSYDVVHMERTVGGRNLPLPFHQPDGIPKIKSFQKHNTNQLSGRSAF